MSFLRNKNTSPLDGLDMALLKKNKALVKKNGTSDFVIGSDELKLDLSLISSEAMQVVERLQKNNFRAYLVGGCIRDLLLGKKPKDFDVSTDATPEQVRKIFSNARIIGRRFKIVHVVFSQDIIEVTTFRSNRVTPQKVSNVRVSAQSGMLLRDNVYGKSIIEDSQRRDFTINALYLDPVVKKVYDYHGGLYDMKEQTLDIIGDPEVRYSEDPVRMIRALRFCAKLGFKISKRTLSPIAVMSKHLLEVSNARMFEEVNKLFLTGHGAQSFKILLKHKIFELLFPATANLASNHNYQNFVEYALLSSDQRYAENKRNMPHFLYAVLLWSVFQRNVFLINQRYNSSMKLVSKDELIKNELIRIINEQEKLTDLPMAVSYSIKSLWRMQLILDDYASITDLQSVVNRNVFRAAFDFLLLRSRFEPNLNEAIEFWNPYYLKSKAQAEKKRAEEQKKRALKEEKAREKKKRKQEKNQKKKLEREMKQKHKPTADKESFADETNLSAKRQEQLKKAKAWRIAMHLEK